MKIQYGVSTIATFSSLLQITPEDCYFCSIQQELKIMITQALFVKYAASQNFFYINAINEILQKRSRSPYIKLKDQLAYDANQEHLVKYYNCSKIQEYGEYYRFHKDVPRMFLKPACYTIAKYQNKKRKIEFARISILLKKEAGQLPDPPTLRNNQTIKDKYLKGVLTDPSYQTILQRKQSLGDSLADVRNKLSHLVANASRFDFSRDITLEHNRTFNLYIQNQPAPCKKKPHKGQLLTIYRKFLQNHDQKQQQLINNQQQYQFINNKNQQQQQQQQQQQCVISKAVQPDNKVVSKKLLVNKYKSEFQQLIGLQKTKTVYQNKLALQSHSSNSVHTRKLQPILNVKKQRAKSYEDKLYLRLLQLEKTDRQQYQSNRSDKPNVRRYGSNQTIKKYRS